jgi:N-acetylglucosamine-6-phosphate deacetylase
MYKAFINTTVFTGEELVSGKAVLIKNDRIEALIDDKSLPENAELFDCGGNYLAPGFIDLQIAGGGGYLFSAKPTAEALKAISDSITKCGTTGFLIAMPTNTPEVYHEVIRTVKENRNPAILGLHFEGPYISHHRKGAHMKDYIKPPERRELEKLLSDAGGVIKMMTVAPEVCTEEIIKLLNDHGVVVAAGHSNATFHEAMRGFGWGISTTTHLFNAMSQMHHRDPGLPGAAFQSETAFASIIADGLHVDYNMISIAKKLMKDRLFLISDAVEENLVGAYQHVRRSDRFTLPDGTMSGSLLSMIRAVKNCVEHVGIPLEEALRMGSLYPARVMHFSDRGQIASGYMADLVAFDRNYDISMVCINGNMNKLRNEGEK